jgi:hypothetical protein
MSAERKRLKKAAAVVLFLLLLLETYAAFGFYAVPYLVKFRLFPALSDRWNIKLEVREVEFDPFAFSVLLRDVRIDTRDGQPLLQLGELFARLATRPSIRERRLVIGEIRLSGPDAHIELRKNRRFNFSDLLPAGRPEPQRRTKTFPVRIARITLEQGRVGFKDHSTAAPFAIDLYPVELQLENVATAAHELGRFKLSATGKTGGKLSLDGTLALAPFRAEGKLALEEVPVHRWPYLSDGLPFRIRSGTGKLSANYELANKEGRLSLDVAAAALNLNQLKLTREGRSGTLLETARVAVRGIGYSLAEQRLTIKALTCEDLQLSEEGAVKTARPVPQRTTRIPFLAVHDVTGLLSKTTVSVGSIVSSDAELSAWLTPEGTIRVPGVAPAADAPTSAPESAGTRPWDVRVSELKLENYALEFKDQTPARTVTLKFSSANLKLADLSLKLDEPIRLDLQTRLGKRGHIKAGGWVTLQPLRADLRLELQQIFLRPFEPYLDKVARIDVIRGRADFVGDLAYGRPPAEEASLSLSGSGSIHRFASKDKLQQKDFLRWESLQVNDLIFETGKRHLRVNEIIARQPYARVIIDRDGTVNFTGVLSPGPAQAATTRRAADAPKPLPVAVGAIRVVQGEADFADLSLQPNFAAGIHGLNGSIRGLSSRQNARADVRLEGKINKDSPVKIFGKLSPFSPLADTNVTLTFRDVDLTTLSPYSGKFAGYRIEKGKLSMDLNYRLRDKRLLGDNSITLDQLVLGERVDSPQATTLPIRFAIALLKDSEGKIDLKLPVSGNLDNPRLGLGDIISNAIARMVSKLVGSPFVLLGNFLNGGGEELGYVGFGPGDATLTAEEKAKLTKLAQALKQRPLLKLDIKGVAHVERDREPLADKALLEQLKNIKLIELRRAGEYSVDAANLELSDEDYARLLIQLFHSRHHAAAPLLASTAGTLYRENTLARLKNELLTNWNVGEPDFRALAQARGRAIRDYLVQEAGISDRRIYLLDVKLAEREEKDARTVLTLTGT